MAPTRKSTTRNARRSNKHLVRSIHRIEMGSEIKPSLDPPTWVSAPWWPLTITATAVKPASYTVQAMYALVLKNLNLAGFMDDKKKLIQFRLRFNDVRIWGLNRQPITLNIPRLNNIGTRIKQLNDRGTPTQYSRLGWRYGMDSELAIDPTDPDVVFEVQGDVSDANKVLIYVRVLIQLIGIPGAATLASFGSQGFVNDLPTEMVQDFELLSA